MKTESASQRLPHPARLAPAREDGRLLRRFLSRVLGRRRRILVNPRYQIRTALLGVTGMGFLTALTVILLSRTEARRSREVFEAAPFLSGALAATHRFEITLAVAGGLLFIAGVFLAAILESRKTAGPVLNLQRRLEEVRSGRLAARVILRRHDNFPELAGAFNEMVGAIRARAEGELATLGRLSAQVSDLLREETRGNREGTRRIAEMLLQSLEDARRRKGELFQP